VAEDEVVGEIETDKVSVKLKLKLNCNIAISCFYYVIYLFFRWRSLPNVNLLYMVFRCIIFC